MAGILQESFDSRNESNNKFPIARGAVVTLTTIISENEKIENFWVNGQLLGFIYTAPDLATDTTFDITITDQDGTILFNDTGLADNKITTPVVVWLTSSELIYLFGTLKMKISFTTAQVATFKIVPIIK